MIRNGQAYVKGAKIKPLKCLRIGVLLDGRIIEDRIIRRVRALSIGESPKADFILPPGVKSPGRLKRLFAPSRGGWELLGSEDMQGRLSNGGPPTELQRWPRGAKGAIALDEKMRGVLELGELRILFHFVARPPTPVRASLPSSVRGGWIKSIDWRFVGILLLSFLLHASLFAWSSTRPIPKRASIEGMPERFARILASDVKRMRQALDPEQRIMDVKGPVQEVRKKRKPIHEPPDKNEISELQAAESAARRQIEIARRVAESGMVALLTSRGMAADSGMVALVDTLSDGARFASIDDTMIGVGSLALASASIGHGRKTGSGPASRSIAGITLSEGGRETMAGRREGEIRAMASLGQLEEIDGGLDANSIKRTVRRHLPAVKHCYEQELRRNPKLKGKVTLEVSVSASGVVSNSEVLESNMNSPRMMKCLLGAIRRWRFARPTSGEVVFSYPFIFEATAG